MGRVRSSEHSDGYYFCCKTISSPLLKLSDPCQGQWKEWPESVRCRCTANGDFFFILLCWHGLSRYIKYNVPTHFTLQVGKRYVRFHSLHSLPVLSQRVRAHVAVQSWASFMSLAGALLGIFLHCSFFNLGLQNQKLFPGCTDDYLTLGKVSNTLKYLT